MKICVCIKQVPDRELKLRLSADLTNIDEASVAKWVINPTDLFAIEEAIKIKEAIPGSTAVVYSLGTKKRAAEGLVTAVAMGCDDGVVIDCGVYSDSQMTAQALASAIKADGDFDLIITGKSSPDLNAGSTGQQIAEALGIPHVSSVIKISVEANGFSIERETERGTKEIISTQGPTLIAATKGLNNPRHTSLPGIMKAKKKVFKELDFNSLGVSSSSLKVKFKNLKEPPERPSAKILTGDNVSQVSELVRLLRDEAKAL